jgi:hypothetical protein
MSKKGSLKLKIFAGAMEKVSPDNFESAMRENRIEMEIEIPITLEEGRIDFGPGFQNQLQALHQAANLHCEAGMYAGLVRTYAARGQTVAYLAKAAKDRHNRAMAIFETGTPEQIETICLDPSAHRLTNSGPFQKQAA